jgi:hypothetical protein
MSSVTSSDACAPRNSPRQEELFPTGQGEHIDLACGVCGEFLVRTPSGWLACLR